MGTSRDEIADAGELTREGAPNKISFEFIKSAFFRVIHVDGAHGGMTPQGKISIALFSERLPIPQRVVHAINPDGSLGPEVIEERMMRQSVVRELEVDLIMDLHTAQVLHDWLGERLEVAAQVAAVSAEREP